MIKYFLWTYFLGIIAFSKAENYCELCKNHTMCEFKNRSLTCGENVESGISESEAEEIVFMHNFYRSRIAKGSVKCGSPGPQPPAANMNALMWDKDLAKVAQRWADQCNFDHDKCRRDPRFQVGQNMFVSIGPSTVDWRRAIKSWYSGVVRFNKSTVDSYQVNVNTNFYTQVVWANTKYIGCGRTNFETTSNHQENSLKLNEFISSVVDGVKSKKKIIKNNTDISSNADIKNHRTKRNSLGYFGGASFNLGAARGALGTVESVHESQKSHMISELSNDGGYYQADGYNMETISDDNGRVEDVSSWISSKRPEASIVYEQPSQPYQQLTAINNNNRYFYANEQPQPVRSQYFTRIESQSPQAFYLDNTHDYSTNYNYRPEPLENDYLDRTIPQYEIKGAFVEKEDDLLDSNDENCKRGYNNEFVSGRSSSENGFDQYNRFVPGTGRVRYYVQTSSRQARSVNSGSSTNNDDDDYYDDDDDDGDIASESEHQTESQTPNKKTSNQEATAQHSAKTRKQILVCNYGPAGNVIDQPIYIKGKPCLECPPNTTCKNGLCFYN